MQPAPRYIAPVQRWILLCLTLIILMVAIGGVTRLTESGLSIVQWKLVSGTLPPLSSEAWQAEFDAYKQTPQFQQVNRDFALGDFKQIFWLEYIHRLLGRIIGLALFVPLAYFTARRALPRRLLARMAAVVVLVGMQGTVGWIMVASGLHDQPRVAPIKLGLHLLLAFSVFGLLLWTRWQISLPTRPEAKRCIALGARGLLALLALQLFLGALVAGLRAGHSYTSYPLMDGQFIPHDLLLLTPWWRNLVESVLTVQFQHRMGALAVAGGILAYVILALRHASSALRPMLRMLATVVLLQFGLGVATLLSGVNIPLASAHQLVALLLLGTLLRVIYLSPLDRGQSLPEKTR